MPRPLLPFVRHLTANQIRAAYRSCRHPVEKVRWHALWLMARTDEPRTPARVAAVVGLSDVTVRAVLHRWNARGPDGVTDRRKGQRGRSEADRAAAGRPVRCPPGAAARWRGWAAPKVARYVNDRWQVAVSSETGWRWLRELGARHRCPAPATPARPTRQRKAAWEASSSPPGTRPPKAWAALA